MLFFLSYEIPNPYLLSSLKNPNDNKTNFKLLGIITLEDVIEKMIKIDIMDEDEYKQKQLAKKSSKGKSNFKRAITNKICQSFIEEKKEQINSLLEHSLVGGSNPKNYMELMPEPEYTLLNNKENI